MAENPQLLTIVVISGLAGALILYLLAWSAAWCRRGAHFLGWWLGGTALLAGAGLSPFLLGLRFAPDRISAGFLEMAARLFLVVNTMGAFVPLAVIAGAALLLGALFNLISRPSA